MVVLALTAFGCKQMAAAGGSAGVGAAGAAATGVSVGSVGAAGIGAAGVGPQGIAGANAPVAMAGASGVAGGSAGSGSSVDPNSFTAIYENIIVGVGCNAGAACHAGTVGGLTMTSKDATYSALVGVKAMGMSIPTTMNKAMNCKDSGLTRVVAGKPDESLMLLKVERTQPCGDPMPGSPLAADKVAQIRAWISNGAKNN